MNPATRTVVLTLLDALTARDPQAGEDDEFRAVELALAPIESVINTHGPGPVVAGAHQLTHALLNLTARKYNVEPLQVISELRARLFSGPEDLLD